MFLTSLIPQRIQYTTLPMQMPITGSCCEPNTIKNVLKCYQMSALQQNYKIDSLWIINGLKSSVNLFSKHLFIQNLIYPIHEVRTMQTTEVTGHRNTQLYSRNENSIYLAMQACMLSSMTTSLLILQALMSTDDHLLGSCIYVLNSLTPNSWTATFDACLSIVKNWWLQAKYL